MVINTKNFCKTNYLRLSKLLDLLVNFGEDLGYDLDENFNIDIDRVGNVYASNDNYILAINVNFEPSIYLYDNDDINIILYENTEELKCFYPDININIDNDIFIICKKIKQYYKNYLNN